MKIYRSFKRPHVRLNRACVTHVIGVHTHSRTYCDARTHIRERNIAAIVAIGNQRLISSQVNSFAGTLVLRVTFVKATEHVFLFCDIDVY